MKRLFRHARVRSVLVRAFGWYLDMTLRSKRWTLVGAEHLARCDTGEPMVVAFWHEVLPLMPVLVRFGRRRPGFTDMPILFLVSRHNDGQFISAIMQRFDLTPIYGSSSKGGPAALQSMLRALRAGAIIGITPDGPRGPARQAAVGVAQLAALAGVPVIPIGGAITNGPRLPTWDRMMLPLPFGRGVLICGPPITVNRQDWREAVPRIAAEMNEAMGRARQLCSA